VRLGDAGPQALIEFVGERDRVKTPRRRAPVVADEDEETDERELARATPQAGEREAAEKA
jgi:large subunit ribosomal protein L17